MAGSPSHWRESLSPSDFWRGQNAHEDTIRSQSSVTCPAGLDVGLECAEARFSDGGGVGVVPEMVWVGSFSNTHIGPYPRSLGEGNAFEKALGYIPGILLVENQPPF